MKNITLLFSLFLLISQNISSQQNINVTNLIEYNKAIKNAVPGTNIILKNGIWKDVHLKAYGKGLKDNPIVIKAEKAGEVIISGNSKLQIYGEHIVVQGLWFKNGNPTHKSIVSFKKNSELFANNCRFTHNTISYYNPEDRSLKTHWVDLWGKNNRVDHNNFTGKTNLGTTLVVWLKGDAHTENNHIIDYNYFGSRPEFGANGAETIRIGTSTNSKKSSQTLVENNTFKNCDGEIEIISNKSCDNIYRNNLFISSKGSLTLRHGNNALVENNVFLGNNIPKTGGIRVINEGHVIQNNLLIGLAGRENRGPIVVMNGVPNSPLNRYHQVKNVSIQNNTLINCGTIQFAADKDEEKTLPPINTVFANNLVSNTNGTKISNSDDDTSGITFKNNVAETTAQIDPNLFTKKIIEWGLLKSLPIPTEANNNLVSNYKNSRTPKKDIVDTDRTTFSVGAFNLGNKKYPKALTAKPGPYWKPNIIAPIEKPKTVIVKPGINTLYKAIKKAGPRTILKLEDGVYFVEKEQKINGNTTIIGSNNTVIEANKGLEKPFKSFFKINGGGVLNIKNITFNGDSNDLKYAIISPSKGEAITYSLFIDNCNFLNFKNKKGAIIKAYANTLADTISVKNSNFNNSYRGINLHSKENALGKANANVVLINNTVFKNLEQYAIKYNKNITDLDPNKGQLIVSNSIFRNVFNNEKGKIIYADNIPVTEIKNSVFENSFNLVTTINLKGINSKIYNCVISSCGKLKNTKGSIAKDIFYQKPKWEDKNNFIPSPKSILLKENNLIETIGLLK